MPSFKVLLVDDDPTALIALREMLHARFTGVQADVAYSVATAFKRVLHTEYDAVVTDVRMPIADGHALLASVRKVRPHTPVILISGYGDYALALKAMRSGAYDLIQKPIDPDYFCRSLESAVLTYQAQQGRLGAEGRAASARPLAELRVLAVDDNPAARLLLARTLASFGAEVLQAGSVVEALEAIQAHRPDIVVCDLRLPDEDGYALPRKLSRRLPAEGGRTPLVALTGYPEQEPRHRALAAGFRTYLNKDTDPAVIAAVLATVAVGSANSAG